MMSRKIGDTVPDRITISFTPLNKRKIDAALKNKEFTSVVSLVNHALTIFFENQNRVPSLPPEAPETYKAWLESPDGKAHILALIRQVKDEAK